MHSKLPIHFYMYFVFSLWSISLLTVYWHSDDIVLWFMHCMRFVRFSFHIIVFLCIYLISSSLTVFYFINCEGVFRCLVHFKWMKPVTQLTWTSFGPFALQFSPLLHPLTLWTPKALRSLSASLQLTRLWFI